MLINKVLDLLPHQLAYAHCDIPCGIYDPNNLQMAAHTIYRMTELLRNEKDMHKVSRLTRVKEIHSDILEKEIATLADDYFKEEHYKNYKDLEDIFDELIGLSMKARQNIDPDSAALLIEKTNKVAQIYYQTKGLESKRVKAPYPTEKDITVQS